MLKEILKGKLLEIHRVFTAHLNTSAFFFFYKHWSWAYYFSYHFLSRIFGNESTTNFNEGRMGMILGNATGADCYSIRAFLWSGELSHLAPLHQIDADSKLKHKEKEVYHTVYTGPHVVQLHFFCLLSTIHHTCCFKTFYSVLNLFASMVT